MLRWYLVVPAVVVAVGITVYIFRGVIMNNLFTLILNVAGDGLAKAMAGFFGRQMNGALTDAEAAEAIGLAARIVSGDTPTYTDVNQQDIAEGSADVAVKVAAVWGITDQPKLAQLLQKVADRFAARPAN